MMENLFINIIEISITSAAAIGIILLFSKLFENKFRKKWRYWVWVFVAVYLIIPFKIDLPDAPIQIELPKHEMVITRTEETIPEKEQIVGSEAVVPGTSTEQKPEEIVPEKPVQTVVPETENVSSAIEPKTFIYPIVFVGAVIWAAGAVLVCGWNVAMYLRFVNRSRPWNRNIKNENVLKLFEYLKAEMGVSEKVRIFENRLIKSPMMVGFIKPRVLLPAEALLPEEYEFVLRHELTHYKRGDLWYKMLLMLAASVHWFNPMIGTMCRYAENDIEITCDEAVVKAMEGDRRQEYCATILNIMRRGQNSPLLLSTSFYGGARVLKKRFSEILQPKNHKGTLLFVIAVLIVVICGTMVACGAEEEESFTEKENNNEISEEMDTEPEENIENEQEEIQKPVVTGPDENGYFPVISQTDWDRWVTYDGEPDTVKPSEPVSSVLECKEYLEYLSETYPDINDWEIIYEKNDYELVTCYDPYTYSHRDIYMPKRFAVLKTEQSEDFDRLFVSTREVYAAVVVEGGIRPTYEFESGNCTAFEADVQVGDMSGAELYDSIFVVYQGLWFPKEKKTIVFDPSFNVAYAVYGTKEPINVYSMGKFGYFYDINDKKVNLPEDMAEDMYVHYSVTPYGFKSAMKFGYYDIKTKKLYSFEGLEDYAGSFVQVYWLNSERLVLEAEGNLYFYSTKEGDDPFALIGKFGGSGNGLTETKVTSLNILDEDSSYPGRYSYIYTNSETLEHCCCIFDANGNIIENLRLGVCGGSIGSNSFHDGLVYFSHYHDGGGSTRYAIDARPGKDHILQANAW